MLAIDWSSIFVPSGTLAEIVVRGTVVYLLLFLGLRFFLKRNAGHIGVADLLVIVLISEVAQGALVGEANSVPEAALGMAVILFWTFALNWLSFRIPALAKLTAPAPLPIIEDGRLNRVNMRRELITYDELVSQMRQQGIDDVGEVRRACLEGDGNFSFVRRDKGDVAGPKDTTIG